MTTVSVALEAFHLLRPLWLLALPALALLWWRLRSNSTKSAQQHDAIAPHLRAALTLESRGAERIKPIDSVALALVLLTIAAAGPTWSRQPDPFAAQSAPLVIALKVAPSMLTTDIAPNRLERAKHKIRDLLELRSGARTALVAYSGSAHLAVPLTEDPSVMLPYLEGLSPEIMPVIGDRAVQALDLGLEVLSREPVPGGILFVTDGLDPADVAALNATGDRTAVLAILPPDQGNRGLDSLHGPQRVALTTDASDVARIDRMLMQAMARAALADSDQPWKDQGHWFAWPAALVMLLWFRRGWTMRWAGFAALALLLPAPQARADSLVNWFLTPDQQGQLAVQDSDFRTAAEHFDDPLWRGYAQYRSGQYVDAVETLNRLETAQAAAFQGMAHIRSRSYRDAVRAFETALSRDPDFPGIAENLEVAREILAYVEDLREQTDTDDDTENGPDDIVYDNQDNRGMDAQIMLPRKSEAEMPTMAQWMATIDTRTGDFLKSRFALEAAHGRDNGGANKAPVPEGSK